MKRKLSIKKICIFILSVFVLLGIICCVVYNMNLKAVSKKSIEVEFEIGSGNTYYTIAHELKEEGLIKNEFCYKLYLKFNRPSVALGSGVYKLNKNMTVKELVKSLASSNSRDPNAITLTFKEGKNIRWIANYIAKNTNNTEEDVFKLLNDQTYLKELIN